MKMNRQNPGGEVHSKPTMKGCEKYQTQGQGSVLGGKLQTNYALASPGMNGMSKGGHASDAKHKGGHAHTSFSGSAVTGTTKANRQ